MNELSQSERIIKELKKTPKGVPNYRLAQLSLKYSSRITELRHDGWNIYCERQHLKNGRASGTYLYFLNEEE
jgi:hypothetical protein